MVVPTKKCKSAPVWQQALLIVLFDKSQYSPIVNRKFLAMFPRILHWYFQHFHHYKINSTILDSFARTHQLLIWYNYLTKPEIEPQNLSFSLFTQSAAASFAFRPKLCLLPWGQYIRCGTHNHNLLWNRSSVMLSTPLFKVQWQQTSIPLL